MHRVAALKISSRKINYGYCLGNEAKGRDGRESKKIHILFEIFSFVYIFTKCIE